MGTLGHAGTRRCLALLAAAALTRATATVAMAGHVVPMKLLADFPAPLEGGIGLSLGTNGLYYGASYEDAANQYGNIFAFDPKTRTFTTLHSFNGNDGYMPLYDVTLDKKGIIYGTTPAGGLSTCNEVPCGVLFRVNPKTAHYTVLHYFAGSDGANPSGSVVFAPDGNLYGATDYGGSTQCQWGCGTLFKFDVAANTFSTVYEFTGGSDSSTPGSPVLSPIDGKLYGTTLGGVGNCFCGTIYRFGPATDKFATIYTFPPSSPNRWPETPIAFDAKGIIYGVSSLGDGTIFQFDPATGQETTLYMFAHGPEGRVPAGLIVDPVTGNLYGTTVDGGSHNEYCYPDGCGVVFELAPPAPGKQAWTYTRLHAFKGRPDGDAPTGLPMIDKQRGLVGTTIFFGSGDDDNGTIYRIALPLHG